MAQVLFTNFGSRVRTANISLIKDTLGEDGIVFLVFVAAENLENTIPANCERESFLAQKTLLQDVSRKTRTDSSEEGKHGGKGLYTCTHGQTC